MIADDERQHLTLLKSIYEERIIALKIRIAQIDKELNEGENNGGRIESNGEQLFERRLGQGKSD